MYIRWVFSAVSCVRIKTRAVYTWYTLIRPYFVANLCTCCVSQHIFTVIKTERLFTGKHIRLPRTKISATEISTRNRSSRKRSTPTSRATATRSSTPTRRSLRRRAVDQKDQKWPLTVLRHLPCDLIRPCFYLYRVNNNNCPSKKFVSTTIILYTILCSLNIVRILYTNASFPIQIIL